MAIGIYDEDDIRSIANSIRDNGGDDLKYTAKEMPNGVASVASKNYDLGVENGRNLQMQDFWDVYQDYGNRNDYSSAFYNKGWTPTTYKPKYSIITKPGGNQSNVFAFSLIEDTIVDIDITPSSTVANLFSYCQELKTIRLIKVNENIVPTNWFSYCYSLENITIEGAIGQSGLDLHWSTKLSKESIKSVINSLSYTTNSLTVTLSKEAVNRAFETSEGVGDGTSSAEWLELLQTKTNWNISLS